jgi:hypothetical protein
MQALASRDMTRDDRRDAMERLLEEWAQRDPAGLIRYLDQLPVWPPDLGWSALPAGLADSRPDLLLDLAIRHGWSAALTALESGDPETVARLIGNLPEGN